MVQTDKKGFTIIEMLISLAILSIAMGSLYGLYMNYLRVYTTEGTAARVQQSVRSSLGMMVRDIRMAGLDPARTRLFGIKEADSVHIRFTADRDMDGELDDPNAADGSDESDLEDIAFVYDGSNLLEMILYKTDGSIELRDTLVNNVTDFSFSYLDSDGGTPASLEEIRTVVITMTIEKPAGQDGTVRRSLVKRVKCRNLHYD